MKLLHVLSLIFVLQTSGSFAQEEIRIPNIITPNSDGINDIFTIRSQGFEGLTCSIFNRYGEPVYRFFGLNGSWDGFTHAGIKVSPGTYFLLVEFELPNGEIVTRQGTLLVQY